MQANKRQRLLNHVETAILCGSYRPGDRLPSIRDFAEQFNTSFTTARSALVHLQEAGFIEICHGNGIFVRHRGEVPAPAAPRCRIGLFLPENAAAERTQSYSAYALRGFQEEAAAHGCRVIDRGRAVEDGNFLLRRLYHLMGEVERVGGNFLFTQKESGVMNDPARFALSRGDDATTLIERNWAENTAGYASGLSYPLVSDPDQRVVHQSSKVALKKGASVFFADYFSHPDGAPPAVRRLGPAAWFVTGPEPQLAVVGTFAAPGFRIEAEQLLVTGREIVGRGVRHCEIAGRKYAPATDGNLYLAAAFDLSSLAAAGEAVVPRPPEDPQLPELRAVKSLRFAAPVSRLAAAFDRLAVGGEDGTLRLLDTDGNELWQATLNNPVATIAAHEHGGRRYWAVGTRSPRPGAPKCELALFDGDGKELWRRELDPTGETPGSVHAIVFLNRQTTEPVIACGQLNGRYSGWSLAGDFLWFVKINHGAGYPIAKGDVNGDGDEEVIVSERWRTNYILSAAGKQLNGAIRTFGHDRSLIAAAAGAGKVEGLAGNDDGYIRRFGLTPRYGFQWMMNAGGRPLELAALDDGRFAALTDNDRIIFFSGQGERLGGDLLLPAEPIAMIGDGKRFYVADCTGAVYAADARRLTRKFRFDNFAWITRHPPALALCGGRLFAAAGAALHILE